MNQNHETWKYAPATLLFMRPSYGANPGRSMKKNQWRTIILLLSFYLKWRWISFHQPMLSSLLNISSPPNLNIDVSLNQDCPDIISPFSWFYHFGGRGVGKGTTKVVVAENQIISWWYLYNYLSELSWYHLPISLTSVELVLSFRREGVGSVENHKGSTKAPTLMG